MSKLLRLLAIALFLIATLAFATTPSSSQSFNDGTNPVPLCRPGSDCQP